MITIAVIGLGSRGSGYMHWTRMFNDNDAKIVAICEKDEGRLRDYQRRFNIDADKAFLSDDEFFAAGKLADAIFICTQDRDHYGHALKAIDCGYHIVCEKPVSPIISQCWEIRDKAKEKGVYLVVCHVLRYSTFYGKMNELIKSGRYGRVMNINHTENIGYFHFAHSYVRGNWHSEEETSPMLLAKCCHDFDLMNWFMNAEPVSISSLGELTYFKEKYAPEGAAARCLDCPKDVKKKCPYDAEKLYITDPIWRATFVRYRSKTLTGLTKPKKSDKYDALRNGGYGLCVFKANNDVNDHQTTLLDYGDGRYVTITTTAFSKSCFRRTIIHMEKADIFADDSKGTFIIKEFHQKKKKIRTDLLPVGHLNGDMLLVKNFIRLLKGEEMKEEDLTFMDATIVGHRDVLLAIESSKRGGERLYTADYLDVPLGK